MERNNRRSFGMEQECRAAQYLERKGCRILERNFYCRQGELDIIAETSDHVLVFLEVKYRKNRSCGLPEEAVHSLKQSNMRKAAQRYLYLHPELAEMACRFDVISILGSDMTWIQNAFAGW